MYNRTSQISDIQHNISHYNHLHDAKSYLKKMKFLKNQQNSRFNTKLYHSIQRQRKIQNKKLLEKLLEIHKKKHSDTLDRYFYHDIPTIQEKKHKSIEKNSDSSLQEDNSNQKKKKKQSTHAPDVWSTHYQNSLQNVKKLSQNQTTKSNHYSSQFIDFSLNMNKGVNSKPKSENRQRIFHHEKDSQKLKKNLEQQKTDNLQLIQHRSNNESKNRQRRQTLLRRLKGANGNVAAEDVIKLFTRKKRKETSFETFLKNYQN